MNPMLRRAMRGFLEDPQAHLERQDDAVAMQS